MLSWKMLIEAGSAGLYSAALFNNPNMTTAPSVIDDENVPRELHTLACSMFLTIDFLQDGAPALIERFGYKKDFLKGIELLGWPELTWKLGRFLALMEPYADDAAWWTRFEALDDIGAFASFDRWFSEQELELDRRVVDFVRRNETTIFIVVERLFSYGTLQQEDVQCATFGQMLEGVPDALVGFAEQMLEITDPDVLAKSGKRFHPIVVRTGDAADRVAGTVFLVTPAELSAADAYEVDDYERISVTLASGFDAWVYVKR